MTRVGLMAALLLLATWSGLLRAAGTQAVDPNAEWPVSLVDVAAQAGLVHPSIYGGVARKRFIIETNGAGVAFLDYDNDGRLDALVLSGTRLEEGGRDEQRFPADEAPTNRLYRGNGDGTFQRRHGAGGPRAARAGPRRSARATTTTTAGWTSSSPTTGGTSSIATAAVSASRT